MARRQRPRPPQGAAGRVVGQGWVGFDEGQPGREGVAEAEGAGDRFIVGQGQGVIRQAAGGQQRRGVLLQRAERRGRRRRGHGHGGVAVILHGVDGQEHAAASPMSVDRGAGRAEEEDQQQAEQQPEGTRPGSALPEDVHRVLLLIIVGGG